MIQKISWSSIGLLGRTKDLSEIIENHQMNSKKPLWYKRYHGVQRVDGNCKNSSEMQVIWWNFRYILTKLYDTKDIMEF